jgi:hypothetical protein
MSKTFPSLIKLYKSDFYITSYNSINDGIIAFEYDNNTISIRKLTDFHFKLLKMLCSIDENYNAILNIIK